MRLATLLLLLLLVGCSALGFGIPSRPDKLGLGTVSFDLEKPARWELENGLIVFYIENKELPLMGGTLYFPGGSLWEPADMAGLASATGSQMREGAVSGMTPEQLDQELDDLGASVEAGFGDEYGTAAFSSLSEDFDRVFSLFAKVVREPAFNEKRFQLWKKLSAEGIRRRRDSPDTMASMSYNMLVYGEDSPYSRVKDHASLARISRSEMRSFHKNYVRPNGARLALTGSLSREEVSRYVEKYFGDWKRVEEELPTLPPVTAAPRPGIFLLKRDFDQAVILMGHLGPQRLSADMYEMAIFNVLFGHGSFDSTLFEVIRSKLGLAYSVYGGLAPGAVKGTFDVYAATRVGEAPRAISEMSRLISESRETLPDAKKVADAKSSSEKSFVFKFDTPGKVVSRAAMLEMLNYPENYDAEFLSNTEAVTVERVAEVPKRWVKPEELTIVVVGDVSPEALSGLGLTVNEFTFDTKPRF